MMLCRNIFFFWVICAFSLLACASDTTRTLSLDHIREKYKGQDSHFVHLEGVDIHYRDSGKGPAILLVHGTLGDAADWDGWVAELVDQHRVIRMDLPAFGLSGYMANGNYSIDRALSTIDALMDHLGEETFAIAGISYGGIVTFRYAATRTERVTAMVLVNSAGIQAGKQVKAVKSKTDTKAETDTAKPQKVASTTINKTANKPANKAPQGNLFTNAVVTEEDVRQFYRGYINDAEKRTPEFIGRKLDLLNIAGRDTEGAKIRNLYERGNPQRVLSHVRAPSAILWGQGNKALDLETAQAFVDSLKNACHTELHTFESGGHYINVERPAETARKAKGFLKTALIDGIASCQRN